MSNAYDFNSAQPQQSFDCIPTGTIVLLGMTIRPGGCGDDGWMTESKSSDAKYFNCEFVVIDGPFAKRKIWQNIGISGGKLDDRGNSIYGNMGRTQLRAILESARGIMPDDQSERAVSARRTNGWGDFNGMVFPAKLKITKGKDGYADKNEIAVVITPDMKEYAGQANPAANPVVAPVAPAAPPWQAAAPVANASKSPTPSWAR